MNVFLHLFYVASYTWPRREFYDKEEDENARYRAERDEEQDKKERHKFILEEFKKRNGAVSD